MSNVKGNSPMTDIEFKEIMSKMIKDHPRSWGTVLKQKASNKYLMDYIKEKSKDFPEGFTIGAKLYFIFNGLKDYPKCVVCGKHISKKARCDPFDGFATKYCSISCSHKDEEFKEKMYKLNMEKYGVKWANQTKEAKDKMKASISERTEYEQMMINEKRKNTCTEKYGVESISQVSEIHNRAVNGVKRFFKSLSKDELQEFNENKKFKREQNLKKKYGDNWEEEYGNYISNVKRSFSEEKKKEINEKTKKTNIEKYGYEYSVYSEKSIKNRRITRYKKVYKKLLNDNYVEPQFTLDDLIENGYGGKVWTWKCKKCGSIFESAMYENPIPDNRGLVARCYKCYPKNPSYSVGEIEVANYVSSIIPDCVKRNVRDIIASRGKSNKLSHKELDIYIESKKVAIEYNGMIWHSFNPKIQSGNISKDYHFIKQTLCEEKGISLIQIFDSEWVFKNDVCKSIIRKRLGCYDEIVDSVTLTIKPINAEIAIGFIRNNSLFDSTLSIYSFGLFRNEELLCVVQFNTPKTKDSENVFNMVYCEENGIKITNGVSKALSYFKSIVQNCKTIMTYIDRRTDTPNIYLESGFILEKVSKPEYWYFNTNSFMLPEPRYAYMKHKLKNMFDDIDETMTEKQIMDVHGYGHFYDCGRYVLRFDYD